MHDTCPNCGGYLNSYTENYGTDADGNRGVKRTTVECQECDWVPGEPLLADKILQAYGGK